VSIVEIYNELVHDLLSADGKRQVELQKTGTGFDAPDLTKIGACAHATCWFNQTQLDAKKKYGSWTSAYSWTSMLCVLGAAAARIRRQMHTPNSDQHRSGCLRRCSGDVAGAAL
jgi:hypothetical protein